MTISIYIRFHSCQHAFSVRFSHSVTFETPEKIIIQYMHETCLLIMQSQSQLFVSYLFVHLLPLIHTIYIPLFLSLSFTLSHSYTISLFLSFFSFFLSPSFPFISLSLSLTHIHSFYAQKTDNIQFDIICANGRKRSLRIMCLLHT